MRKRVLVIRRTEACPDCGAFLVRGEGCALCPVCGFTKCG
jgi:hypothetical protein